MSVVTLKTEPRPRRGTAMDTPLARPGFARRHRAGLVAAGLALLAIAGALVFAWSGSTHVVAARNLTIATVRRGQFEDFLLLRARVTPLNTVFLDAVEGGRVDRILARDGDLVTAGQPLAVLSNASLQLDVIGREADVSQQLNNLRGQELELQRSRLENRRNLAEIDWQRGKAERQLERDRRLAAGGWVSGRALADAEAEARYLAQRHALTAETLATEAALRSAQLVQLRAAAAGLTANLRLARASLDALVVRAPVAGQLSGFEPQVGQSLARGQRLGQVDSAGRSRLVADIDEFHLGRIEPGQRAGLDWQGGSHALAVARIYPEVRGGTFTADLVFTGAEPAGLQRGQSLAARLTLGDSASALLLPNGAFFADTGGAFVFVVAPGSTAARKTRVRLGRRNPRAIEVLAGLAPGDRVIVSSYAGFADKDRLVLSGE